MEIFKIGSSNPIKISGYSINLVHDRYIASFIFKDNKLIEIKPLNSEEKRPQILEIINIMNRIFNLKLFT